MSEPVSLLAIGGGHGLSALLRAVRDLPLEITGVVSVMDDGGSSGDLRRTRNILPPGDLRRCLLALSDLDSDWLDLLERRFEHRDDCALSGHPLGNLLLAYLLEKYTATPTEALRQAGRLLKAQGVVLPVTVEPVELEAVRWDGSRVRGEVNVAKAGVLLRRLELSPENPPAALGVLSAIATADIILLGPGSLYTSVLPPLRVAGVADALRRSRARVAYLCNPVMQAGETEGMTALHHVQALEAHLGGGLFSEVLVNVEPSTESQRLMYVDPDIRELEQQGYRVHRGRYWSFAMGRATTADGLREALRSLIDSL